jgi:hypothetical protein
LIFVALASFGTACSSDTKTASDQVCDSRSSFSSAVDKVKGDLQSAHFGQARSDADDVRTTFQNLVDSFQKLTNDQRQSLSPQVDQLKSDLSGFSDVSNRSELQNSVDTTRSDLQSIITSIQNDLHCS